MWLGGGVFVLDPDGEKSSAAPTLFLLRGREPRAASVVL